MKKPLIIGVAGGTGSGKSTLTDRLVAAFGNDVALIYHDNYYRHQVGKTYDERAKVNYDHPDAYETELLLTHLEALQRGEAVDCPVYDFTIHNRSDKFVRIEPKPVILIDGILILADERLRDHMDVKVFVDTDDDIRLIRRIRRDMVERQRSLESILLQYETTVKPMHDLFVAPSREYADIIIRQGGKNEAAFGMLWALLKDKITGL